MGNVKKVHIIAGGTINKVRPHFAIAAPAYGSVGEKLQTLCEELMPNMDVVLHKTRMAGGAKNLETNDDVKQLVNLLKDDLSTKVIIMAAAMADFEAVVDAPAGRLQSQAKPFTLQLTPSEKIIDGIRNAPGAHGVRKDIFLVSFKATAGASGQEQFLAALHNVKRSSSNLVFANDLINHRMMIVTPEEARYAETYNREVALRELVSMIEARSHLTFTRSTVVAGDPIAWNSEMVPESLRVVVDYCIASDAYKPFRDSTVGHFAAKIDERTFVTSRRKTNFNQLDKIGLVKIETDGPDSVVAYGSKPSVGGQSQRIIFSDHPAYDCVVHFHCPIREGSAVPIASQREFECGSHECGKNTSVNLKQFGNLAAVHLDQHGPNIVFHHSIDPQEVIGFIEANFDLTQKTGGYNVAV